MNNLERRLPWIIIALAAAAGIAGYVASSRLFVADTGAVAQPRQLQASLLYPQPKPLPDFALQRSDGSVLGRTGWTGRWRLLFFGFASCPDVCPTALATAKAARAQLRTQRPDLDLAVSFVSVDPERDKPEQLGAYVGFFDPSFEAATGTPAELLALTQSLGVMYVKVPNGPGPLDYTIDHSASLLIIDPQGRLAGLIRPPHRVDAIVADLITLMDEGN
ncbi:MAG: SCO family protein [Rhodanobacteraceae bacterium]|nr:SCO family protein [Rhodanobacteraceae bacterium]